MADDEYGRVPAGWYPDPLGLPQLRWWDNHAWTEHVSDARQPMMPTQPAAATIFADDDTASRRGRRSAESAGEPELPFEQPTAAVLRQLAPPSQAAPSEPAMSAPSAASVAAASAAEAEAAANAAAHAAAAQAAAAQAAAAQAAARASSAQSVPAQSAPAQSAPAQSVPSAANAADAFAAAAFADPQTGASAPQPSMPWVPLQAQGDSAPQSYGSAPGSGSAPGYSSAPGYGSAPGFGSAPGAPAYAPTWTESPVSAADPGRRGTHQTVGAPAPHLQSVEVWAMALLPMLQLLLSLLVLAAFSTGPSVLYMAVIWLAPYPFSILLAWLDHRSLRRRGVDRPASWLWALATPLVYLAARAVQLSRISGAGYGPLAVFLLLNGLVGASVLAVPGLVIAALPAVFAAEASNSIELAAVSIGGRMEVNCPASPPLYIGQQIRCPATTAGGDPIVITASLQRANGWIAWQVDDWGIFNIVR